MNPVAAVKQEEFLQINSEVSYEVLLQILSSG